MGRLMLAIKVFFRILRDGAFAEQAERLLAGTAAAVAPTTSVARPTVAAAAPAARNDAVTLLAVLQREARLIDFLKEDIAPYADAQVGAAVRDVHRDAAAALERMFALRPVMDQAEDSEVTIPPAPDAARMRLVGNLGAQAPSRGRLRHGGWQATRAELPQFTGSVEAARIVAPAEVEV
ncbi:MAG TPA: DUF2760 domain-containing protein [Tepidisphaeraceae bacterium]|jgi:hypothetical protein